MHTIIDHVHLQVQVEGKELDVHQTAPAHTEQLHQGDGR